MSTWPSSADPSAYSGEGAKDERRRRVERSPRWWRVLRRVGLVSGRFADRRRRAESRGRSGPSRADFARGFRLGRGMHRSWRRVGLVIVSVGAVLTCWAAFQVTRVRHEMNAAQLAIDHAESAATDGSVDAVRANLRLATAHTERAAGAMRDPVLSAARHVPVIGRQITVAHALVSAVDDVAQRADDAVGAASVSKIFAKDHHGISSLNLSEIAGEMEPAIRRLESVRRTTSLALDRLENAPSSLLLPQLHAARASAIQRLGDVAEKAATAKSLYGLATDLSAPGKVTRLLLLSQDTWELRPSGGFIGSYGILEIRNGRIHLDSYEDATTLPPPSGRVVPPEPLRSALDKPWSLTGAGWSPDFRIAARDAQALFIDQGGVPVDGAIAVTNRFLEDLLVPLGPMKVPGYDDVVTADNASDLILHHVELKRPLDVPRKRFLKGLTTEVFDRLEAVKGAEAGPVISALGAALGARDLQIALNDTTAQRAISRAGWDGRLRPERANADFLSVADSNFGTDKANKWVRRAIRYTVRWDGSTPVAEVTVTTKSRGPKSAINPYYHSYVRTFAPANAVFTGDRIQRFLTGTSTESGVRVFGTDQFLNVGTTNVITYRYRLPRSVVSQGRYRLYVRPQAGTDDEYEVVVRLGAGARTFTFEGSGDHRIDVPARAPDGGVRGTLRSVWNRWRGALRR